MARDFFLGFFDGTRDLGLLGWGEFVDGGWMRS